MSLQVYPTWLAIITLIVTVLFSLLYAALRKRFIVIDLTGRFSLKDLYKTVGILFLTSLVIQLALVSPGTFTQSALAALAHEAAPSDPQEATIKKVLTESGAAFGWDQSYCWVHYPPGQVAIVSGDRFIYQDRPPVTYCPEVWGPRVLLEHGDYVPIQGAARYGFDVVPPCPNDYLPVLDGPFYITAYLAESAAEAAMNKELNGVNLVPAYYKKAEIHGYKAVKVFDKIITWRVGRFIFSTLQVFDGTITAEELAETLYANAVKFGLIPGDGDTDIDIEDQEEIELIKPVLDIALQPAYFSKPGDRITIQVTYTGEDGAPAAGVTVTLVDADTNSKLAESSTDAGGKTNFVVEHHDEAKKSYTYQLQTPMISKTITVPVFEMGIQLELNSVTGAPFEGVVADGESTLEIKIKLEGSAAGGELRITGKPPLGELEGKAIRSGNVVELLNGEASLLYKPPDYLKTDQLTRQDENISGWAAVVPIVFTYTAADGRAEEFAIEIELYRPPVMLVHGFTGGKTTWSDLSEYLRTRKYDTHSGEYYAGNHSIWEQSILLRDNIGEKKDNYLHNNVKITKVDLVGHSMGGLISRFYINTRFMPWFDPGIPWDSFYRNDVRKLIMVGTPNHGCSYFDLWTGRLISFYGIMHEAAAEQLYSKGDFLTHLNRHESMGLHLNRKVEYGNIYSRSSSIGFFSGDGIVPAASAYLNGVAEYRIRNHIHSPAVVTHYFSLNFKSPSITTSQIVFAKVEEWLGSKIYRPALDNMRILVTKTEGEVYLQDPLLMKDGVIPKKYIKSGTLTAGVPMDSFDFLGTGQDSRATISFFVNNTRWGSIYLDQNTELRLGHISPRLTEVMLSRGSARFATSKLDKSGHFSVNLEAEDGKWQNITALDTDFVVFAGSQTLVHSLDGELIFGMETASGDIIGETITTGESMMATGSDEIVSAAMPQQLWWENSFYNTSILEWIKSYLFIVSDQASSLWDLISSGNWKHLSFRDLAGYTMLAAVFAVCIVTIVTFVITIRRRKWLYMLLIPILAALIITGLIFMENREVSVNGMAPEPGEPASIIEPERRSSYWTRIFKLRANPELEPETETEPTPDIVPYNLEERINNCKVLNVFNMTLQEVINVLGAPDEEGWFAGEYYRWNDAALLIGNNQDGVTEQQELFISGSDIAMIRLDQLVDIKAGMSFQEAKEILGVGNLEVHDWRESEWFEYVMIFELCGYEFIFNGDAPDGPISFIMVR